jgi:hypothetical protein
MAHVCACEAEQRCPSAGACLACGRPLPRLDNPSTAARGIRIGRLANGQFEDGAAQPSAADIAAVTDPRLTGTEAREAAKLVVAWMNRGWLDVPPQKVGAA